LSRQSTDPPVLLIVAGPNGSGKSSVYQDTETAIHGRSFWIVNPDALTVRIQIAEGMALREANEAAVTRIEAWLHASVGVHKSIGVETVLSTDKYRALVTKAIELGFSIWLLYVVLDSPDRNVERVRLRVRKNGHDVPEDKIRARYVRSLQQLPWFLDKAERAWIYDNSAAEPRLMGVKAKGVITLDESALPVVVEAVRSIETE
jgi:predicted ABC-type ATPase